MGEGGESPLVTCGCFGARMGETVNGDRLIRGVSLAVN